LQQYYEGCCYYAAAFLEPEQEKYFSVILGESNLALTADSSLASEHSQCDVAFEVRL